MAISWLKQWWSELTKHKIIKKLNQRTNRFIDKVKQNTDLADIVTTASFLLILFVAYLILNRTAFLAGAFFAGATFLRYVDDNVILATSTVPKLRKFYNVLLNIASESLIIFALIIYFYTLNVYAAVILTLLLLILNLISRYIFLLAQTYKIRRVDEFFKRLYLFCLLSIGLLFDQVLLVIVLSIILEAFSIYRMIEQIRQVLTAAAGLTKGRSTAKKKIAKKK